MISIIIPAHNEEKRIGPTLEEYGKFFEERAKEDKETYEILVVLNACHDKTLEIVKNYSKKFKIIKYLDLEKGGKGYAVISGFKEVINKNSNLIGFVDADMATTPESFYDLIKNINSYEGIIASRYIKGAIVTPKPTIQRVIVSRIFNFLVRAILILPYRDTQCGAKLFKKKALEKIIGELSMSKFAFDVELLYHLKKKGFRVKEYATKWGDKKYSTINFMKAGPLMLMAIIRLRIINSPFESFIKIYDYTLNKLNKLRAYLTK
jgi:glycosyltransferase involved in cell wall biosynthesis